MQSVARLPRKFAMIVSACWVVMTALSYSSAYGQDMPMPQSGSPQKASPCPQGQHLDPLTKMCMPGEEHPSTTVMFQLNQFMVYSNTSGPRGQSRATGPGHWTLMLDKDVSTQHHLSINVMGSLEQWTVGDKGTPQLFQTEHVDSMHAHDTVMALEFRDVVALAPGGTQKLTLLFAPRGEAAVGPVPFMHRESAEGNPDAPLGHTQQDGFHDASTVFGLGYHIARTTAEVTAFSGQSISWPFPMHPPDSYSVRVNQGISDHVGVGASVLNVLLPEDGGASHNRFISAWLTTSHVIGHHTLKSSSIWGQVRDGEQRTLNSVLEEVVYQAGKNKAYGRAETLQATSGQLDIVLAEGATEAGWVQAYTAGYERTLVATGGFTLYGGGSYTKNVVPAAFQPAYGSEPRGVKASIRISWAVPQMQSK